MSLIKGFEDRVQKEVFTSPSNVIVKVLGYSEDKKSLFVRNLSRGEYHSGAPDLPEFMCVNLEDIDKDVAGSLRGTRKSIADRANKKDLSYVKGDPATGGLVILQAVNTTSEIIDKAFVVSEGGEAETLTFTIASCRWIDAGASDTEKLEGGGASARILSGVAINVSYREASLRYSKPFCSLSIMMPRKASKCASMGEVEASIAQWFETSMPKLMPTVYVRANDGKQSVGYMLRKHDKKQDDGTWLPLRGQEALEQTKRVAAKNWKAISLMVAELIDNKAVTIEVIPGFIEYLSDTQIQNSNLFDSNGHFVDSSKGEYYESHYTIQDDDGLRVRAFYESDAIIRYIDLDDGKGVWTVTAHKPIKQGVDALLGSAKMIPTEFFDPANYQTVIDDFINSRRKSTEAESESEVGQAIAQQDAQQAEPFKPSDDDDGFEPETLN